MSDHKKEAKSAAAAKLQRMGLKLDDGSKSFTDERGGSPFEGLNSGNAGKMPITPSRFKRGGKVSKHANVEGKHAHKNLGKSARKGREHHSGLDGINRVGQMTGPETIPNQPQIPTTGKKNPSNYPTDNRMGRGIPTKNGPAWFMQDTDTPLPTRDKPNTKFEVPDQAAKKGGRIHKAGGGMMGAMTPAQKKAVIGAMVARKKRAGLPIAPPSQSAAGILGTRPVMPMVSSMRKSGGAAKHTDEVQDKKLMHKILKPKAFKAEGGRAYKYRGGELADGYDFRKSSKSAVENSNWDMNNPDGSNWDSSVVDSRHSNSQSLRDAQLKRGGKAMHHEDCSCKMCSGGMAERSHRATGGRTKAGKTNVNIIISPQSGGQGQTPLGAGVGMGQPPVPPMMPPMPMGAPPMGGMPPGMPPMMPPGGGMPPRPPMPPMARKAGGRVGNVMPKYQEKDYGSGSGLGRLEKKKWPVANGTE